MSNARRVPIATNSEETTSGVSAWDRVTQDGSKGGSVAHLELTRQDNKSSSDSGSSSFNTTESEDSSDISSYQSALDNVSM